jgi:hypothetical protein
MDSTGYKQAVREVHETASVERKQGTERSVARRTSEAERPGFRRVA